ncbi:hypothetical protein CDAR_219081 [Caerostris darwini]|uniref:Reverse transcriptase n=1 Tax=Caerostris darwini TaxID=1538125 RepID=A0AAV4VQZ5_9ARAC|nr:hypothetical protein CDAR_219081 [Caerostris darwini]
MKLLSKELAETKFHQQLLFKETGDPFEGNVKNISLNILKKLYPQENPFLQAQTINNEIFEDNQFTYSELKQLTQTLPKGKDPGCDGIDYTILQIVCKHFPLVV